MTGGCSRLRAPGREAAKAPDTGVCRDVGGERRTPQTEMTLTTPVMTATMTGVEVTTLEGEDTAAEAGGEMMTVTVVATAIETAVSMVTPGKTILQNKAKRTKRCTSGWKTSKKTLISIGVS